MSAPLKFLAAALCGLLLGLPIAHAKAICDKDWPVSDVSVVTDVFIHLGTGVNELTVSPPELTLNARKLYRIVVINPSENTHIVAASELAASGLTMNLLKGTPRVDYLSRSITTGISLQPGELLEWTFMPYEQGKYKLGCDDPVHAAAGMHVTVKVVS